MSASENDREAARKIVAMIPPRVDASLLKGYVMKGPTAGEMESAIAEAIATARAEGETAGYAKGRREAFSEMEKAVAALPRYEVGGECDGDSGHCYASMELDDDGRYVGLDDIAAALRAKANTEAPHE